MKPSKKFMCRCLLLVGFYGLIFILGAVWYRGNYFPYHQVKAVMGRTDHNVKSYANPLKASIEKGTRRATARIQRLRNRVDPSLPTVPPLNNSAFYPETEIESLFIPLEQEIAKLALTVHRKGLKINSPMHEISKELHVTKRQTEALIEISDRLEVESLRISNAGDRTITNPKLSVNGVEGWHDIKQILAQVLDGHVKPQDRAKAIFQFVVENRQHDEPPVEDDEPHDPVKFFNVYGYGFCDDAATNFGKLAIAAGMPAKIWSLGGQHVIAEIFYDNSWHLFDPDGEVYYADPSSGNIVGLAEIRKHPDLLKLANSPIMRRSKLERIYTNRKHFDASNFYLRSTTPPHRMNYKLRPGESFCRYGNAKGWYFTNFYGDEPKNYSNGVWRFSPRFDLGPRRSGCSSFSDVRVDSMRGALLSVINREGSLIYKFKSPWPYITAKMQLSGNGTFKIDISEDGKIWNQAGSMQGEIDVPVLLDNHFPNGFGSPLYAYWLRIRFEGRLDALTVESIVQTAPKSFPKFKAGDNETHYSQESPIDGSVVLTLELAESNRD
jgi:hypothetical protein